MSSTGIDSFERAQQRTNAWLAAVADEFDTSDRKFALRALRAWLHAVRDRLTVPVAVKFAAQLPELLRGIYYDGWSPGAVPMKLRPEEFVSRFAAEARIRIAEVPAAAGAVTAALRRHMSEGQVDEALAELPRDLRELVRGVPGYTGRGAHASVSADSGDGHRAGQPAGGRDGAGAAGAAGAAVQERIGHLESRVATLTDAVEVLARGLADGRRSAPSPEHEREKAARLAAEILLGARD